MNSSHRIYLKFGMKCTNFRLRFFLRRSGRRFGKCYVMKIIIIQNPINIDTIFNVSVNITLLNVEFRFSLSHSPTALTFTDRKSIQQGFVSTKDRLQLKGYLYGHACSCITTDCHLTTQSFCTFLHVANPPTSRRTCGSVETLTVIMDFEKKKVSGCP